MPNSERTVIIGVNAGSSSIKLSLYSADKQTPLELLAHAQLDGIGTHPHLAGHLADGTSLADETLSEQEVPDHDHAYERIRHMLDEQLDAFRPVAVGHRIVHGGRFFDAPVIIDEQVRERIASLTPMAPLHQPHHLSGIDAVSRFAPDVLQVACFDSAFHQARPEIAQLTGLPYRYFEEGIRRYGFHGLSYEYIAQRLREIDAKLAQGRVIVAHLGNGASLCAMENGRSRDTTMSFTALDGLPMGTRCGALDPGAVLYLQGQHELDEEALQHLLYHESGLLGLSGIDSDMQVLLESDDPAAQRAIDFFVYRTAQEMGRMAVTLGGVDGIVFTAGIGEHAAPIREAIIERLAPLWSVRLDETANRGEVPRLISSDDSAITVRVVPTDEEAMLAEHTWQLWRSH
ncbi:acetate/propionate family kinase [Kushneria phosphatilytica]|uniref:Acetate kinase n=1 Tax=Kushneria phosphatilytica TaxID=657387 RepID=A0A1S1NU15_9GAMM|nr:acetate/propionate family kinase [Kushneria phosphatilytica]OHV09699.1 acetate kinase [Kushneria phosphatilytica]QEL11746.1 acetate/propionate family kinase [Kushneria phosphatilytica]